MVPTTRPADAARWSSTTGSPGSAAAAASRANTVPLTSTRKRAPSTCQVRIGLALLERHHEAIRQGHRDRRAVGARRVHRRQRSQGGLQGGGGQGQEVDPAAAVEAERLAHGGRVGVVRPVDLEPVGGQAEGAARGQADQGHQRRHQDDRGADALGGATGRRRSRR